MARRRKWKAPNRPTAQAKQVWAALFPGHAWPKGWRVEWAGFMRGALGMTIYGRREILLSHGDAVRYHKKKDGRGGPVEVLLHEFVHVRCPGLRHGKEFLRLEDGLRDRLGFGPKPPKQVD